MLERQQEQPIGDAGGERDVVGHDDRRDAERLDLLADQPREHAHAMRIEADRRLVEEQQLAPAREHARDRDALRLAARQLGHRRAAARRACGSSPTRVEPRLGIVGVAVAAGAPRVAQRELEVAADVEVIEQRAALRHEPELVAIEVELRRRPRRSPAASSSSRSNSTRANVDLPAPEPPSSTTTSPAPIVEIDAIDQHAAVGQRDAQPAHRRAGSLQLPARPPWPRTVALRDHRVRTPPTARGCTARRPRVGANRPPCRQLPSGESASAPSRQQTSQRDASERAGERASEHPGERASKRRSEMPANGPANGLANVAARANGRRT